MEGTPERKENASSAEARPEGGRPTGERAGSLARPLIAAGLSLLFAGVGHLYLRRYTRGILILIIALFLWRISDYSPRSYLLNVIVFVFAAFDAFSLAKRGIGIL